jgi:hypothetical protein
MVAPVFVAGDEWWPRQLSQEQGHTRNDNREAGILNPDRDGIGMCEQQPKIRKKENYPNGNRYRGDLTKHPGQVRLPHGQSMFGRHTT